jgi:methylglutaconyl-CoA hydratase
MGEYETLLIRDEGRIRIIEMNRPDRRNALNPAMMVELLQALAAATKDDCTVVILTGRGAAFCAGMDLDHLKSMTDKTIEEQREDSVLVARLLRRLYDFPMPTIAAVNGPAIAGGTGIATVCDFTLAVAAAKFGYTEVRIGFIPAIVASFLSRQVGEKQARDMLLTGRIISAEEALALGLVRKIVPETELMNEAMQLAQNLLQNSPSAMRLTKKLLSSHAEAELDAEIAEAIDYNVNARQTADFREGIRSFLEKRRPEWPSLKGDSAD